MNATSHRQAAAVLSHFDVNALRDGAGRTPADAAKADLIDLSVTTELPGGKVGRTLALSDRRAQLASLLDRAALAAALACNPPPDDALQRYLTGIIRGTFAADAPVPDDELTAAIEATEALTGLPAGEPFALPDLDALRRRRSLRTFLMPLETLTRYFVGRRAELAAIDAFLADAADSRPLVFHGIGGQGKSSLLSRAILDYRARTGGPVTLWDLDRRSLNESVLATFLLEAARQLDAQSPTRGTFGALAESITDAIARAGADASRLVSAHGSSGYSWLYTIRRGLDAGWPGQPWFVVVDTFEEVQYRSRHLIDKLWSFLALLRDVIPQMRVVVAGRTAVGQPTRPQIALTGLDRPAAVACLVKRGVPDEFAAPVADAVGGNPLVLRLAAELFLRERDEAAKAGRPFAFDLRPFEDRTAGRQFEAYLFGRIVKHIHDPRVRKLVGPGLLLRSITPDLIEKVLAGPCGLAGVDAKAATALFETLARETALVVPRGDGHLAVRPDIRAQVIALPQLSEPATVRAVHDAAVRYYAVDADPRARAEELYHRLCRGDTPDELDARWDARAEPWLRPSAEELPEAARAYLAGKVTGGDSGFEAMSLTDDFWAATDLRLWEPKAARWARDLIRQDRFAEALATLRQRPERSPTSELFALEARCLKNLGQWAEACRVTTAGLQAWPVPDAPRERADLLLIHAEVCERLGQVGEAAFAVEDARKTLGGPQGEEGVPEVRWLRTLTTAARLSRGSFVEGSRREELKQFVAGQPDALFLADPRLARKAAAELLTLKPKAALQIVKCVGFGDISSPLLLALARQLDKKASEPLPAGAASWVDALSNSYTPGPGGIAVLALLKALESKKPGGKTLELVADILRGEDEVAARDTASFAASARGDVHRELRQRLNEIIAKEFGIDELNSLMLRTFGVELEAIVPASSSLHSVAALLFDWAQANGRFHELVEALARARQANADLARHAAALEGSRSPTAGAALQFIGGAGEEFVRMLVGLFPSEEAFTRWLVAEFGLTGPTSYEAVVDAVNRSGNAGPFLAHLRRDFPTHAALYRFAEDYGLTAATAEQDRAFRDRFTSLAADTWRGRLGEIECGVARVEWTSQDGGPGDITTGCHLSRNRIVTATTGNWPCVDAIFGRQRLAEGTVVNPGIRYDVLPTGFPAEAIPGLATLIPDRPSTFVARVLADHIRVTNPVVNELTRPAYIVYATDARPLVLQEVGDRFVEYAPDAAGRMTLRYAASLPPSAAGAPIFNRELQLLAVNVGPVPGAPYRQWAVPIGPILEWIRDG